MRKKILAIFLCFSCFLFAACAPIDYDGRGDFNKINIVDFFGQSSIEIDLPVKDALLDGGWFSIFFTRPETLEGLAEKITEKSGDNGLTVTHEVNDKVLFIKKQSSFNRSYFAVKLLNNQTRDKYGIFKMCANVKDCGNLIFPYHYVQIFQEEFGTSDYNPYKFVLKEEIPINATFAQLSEFYTWLDKYDLTVSNEEKTILFKNINGYNEDKKMPLKIVFTENSNGNTMRFEEVTA